MFLHAHDTSQNSPLRTNSRRVEDRQLHPDAGNLASILFRFKSSTKDNETKAWERINSLVKRISPCIGYLDPVEISEKPESSIRLDWIDDQGSRFGVHQISDGTLRSIAIITALSQPSEMLPDFICIDEPELGLHPSALGIIVGLARSVSHRTQILFATQSTAFLDLFEPGEVVVAERVEGATQLKRLDEDQLADWLEDYTLSEVFEKGVFGGLP